MAEPKTLGEALLQIMQSWPEEEKAAITAMLRERQGQQSSEPLPIDWAHDGSEIHADSKPGYRCMICRDAGFVRKDVEVGHPSFGKTFPCKCRQQDPAWQGAQMRLRLSKANLSEPLAEKTLASFHQRPGTIDAWRGAVAFLSLMRDMKTPPWLLFTGAPGTGKSHLLAGITIGVCVEVGAQALHFDTRGFLRACKANNFEKSDEWQHKAMAVSVLVLDEFLSQQDRDWDLKVLESVLMHRWERELPVVLAMTRSDEEFHEWSPALHSRLHDRTLARILDLDTTDYRLQEA